MLQDAVRFIGSSNTLKSGRKHILTEFEELIIFESIFLYADRQIPMVREHVADAVDLFLKWLSGERRLNLQFQNNRTGRSFLGSFIKRQAEKLTIGLQPVKKRRGTWLRMQNR